jgi:hypothetical protein
MRDDELLRLATDVPQPRATTARLEQHRQAIFDSIAAEQVSRRLTLSPLAAGLVAIVVAGAALAGTAVMMGRSVPVRPLASEGATDAANTADGPDTARPPPDVDVIDLGALVDADAPPPTVAVADEAIEPPLVRARPASSKGLTATRPRPSPLAVDIGSLVSGDDVRAAGGRLGLAFRQDRATVDRAVNDAINTLDLDGADDDAVARLRRLRCELHLRFGREVAAMDVCAAFIRYHPDNAAARPLAFGAGGLAEELGLLDHAIARYSDAIVLAPLAGQSSADALKARARVHARMGHDDDARADLRVFLSLRPAGAYDDDVTGLATRLGLPLPR